MSSYDVFSKLYDTAVGERNDVVELLRGFINAHPPKGKKLLEIACGTGGILRHFAGEYELHGLDISKGMLAVAREDLPNAKLYRRNMVDFQLHEKFDVILCVYDSINHLLKFEDWNKTFANAARHLAPGGVFIFDINTREKLSAIVAYPPEVHKLGEDYFILNVRKEKGNVFNWHIRFFFHGKGNTYTLREENIRETAFPAEQIAAALKKHFRSVKFVDAERKRPSKHSERLYFICKK